MSREMLRCTLSRRLAGLLAAMHALALAALPPVAMPLGLKLVLAGAIGFSAVRSIRRMAWLRGDGVPTGLTLHADGRVTCWLNDGRALPARVLPDSTVWLWLIVLRLGFDDGQVRSLVLATDSLGPDEHRRLRAWLRWRSQKPALNADAAV